MLNKEYKLYRKRNSVWLLVGVLNLVAFFFLENSSFFKVIAVVNILLSALFYLAEFSYYISMGDNTLRLSKKVYYSLKLLSIVRNTNESFKFSGKDWFECWGEYVKPGLFKSDFKMEFNPEDINKEELEEIEKEILIKLSKGENN